MTSCLLYTLAQLGFEIDILSFGMNVVMDTVNLAGELTQNCTGVNDADGVDLSSAREMEG